MKRNLMLAGMMLTAGSLLAADPKEDVTNAAKKLADSANYSWKQTTENAGGGGGGGGRGGGPVEGKADKDGTVYRKLSFGGNDIETVTKGTNGAMNGQDGWQTFAEMAANFGGGGGGGGGGFRGGGFGGGQPTPAQQAEDLLKETKDLKESGGTYVGDLTETGAKAFASPFGRGGRGGRPGGGGGGGGGNFTPPEVTDAKGNVRFWVKDGVLSKYEFKVTGKTTNRAGDPQDINRTTTVEIKDVGTTKITIPDDIKKKIN